MPVDYNERSHIPIYRIESHHKVTRNLFEPLSTVFATQFGEYDDKIDKM